MQLQTKVYQCDRVRRVYDVAQRPLQRLLASGRLSEDRQRDLCEQVQQIDPLALSEHLDVLRHALLCGTHTTATDGEREFLLPLLRFSLVSEEGPGQRMRPRRLPSPVRRLRPCTSHLPARRAALQGSARPVISS